MAEPPRSRDDESRREPGTAAQATPGLDRDLYRRRLLLARVTLVSSILVAAVYIQYQAGAQLSLTPLFLLLGVTYALSLGFLLSYRAGLRSDWVSMVQLSADVLVDTLLIYFLGGVESPLIVLYLITLTGAGLVLDRRGALGIASLAAIGYGVMADLIYLGVVPAWAFERGTAGAAGAAEAAVAAVSEGELYLRIFTVIVGCYGVALVSSHMGRRLREARRELQAERVQVEALEELNQQIIDNMSSGLIATDGRGRIVTCNGPAAEITGRATEELRGRPVWELFGGGEEMVESLGERLGGGSVYRTEQPLARPDGERRIIGMSVTRMGAAEAPDSGPDGSGDAGGRLAEGFIFMFQDLTGIKRMERELRIRDRMAVLGEMAGSIAHEIRNPLASISGSLQMLREGDRLPEKEGARDLMEIVIRESERLSRTIEDFLEYARPGDFRADEVDLLELAEETFALLRNSAELTDAHELVVDAGAEDYVVVADPSQIQQVFWNLARNAVEAMPDGGKLEIRLRRRGRSIEAVFEDTGVGMGAEEVERFFQPYVSGTPKGTGLGLAVVYRILERHGVAVAVDSEPGEGTRFILTFEGREGAGPSEQLVLLGSPEEDEESDHRAGGDGDEG